jgi:hypothetical protein
MRLSNTWAVPLLVPGLLAAAWCWAAPAANDQPPPEAGPKLVVHEWGTFSTFSGSDGKNLKFFPYDNDLPDFVHGYLPKNSKAGPEGGTISLETPVVYFYTKQALTASLRVDFPRGTLTEWYPRAERTNKQLSWKEVKVLPGQDPRLPAEAKKSRYYEARETDAAPLRVAGQQEGKPVVEQEKFLFYRGVGTFDMPLSARALGGGRFTVRWSGEGPVGDLILVRVQAGKIRFQPFRLDRRAKERVEGDVRVPARDATAAELGEVLVKSLTAQGLFEKEARAMVKTWSSAWFGEEGTRILYLLPDRLTDELLPLRVEPKPAALVRVLVGRHDVLTPEWEKQIDVWVAELSRETPTDDAKRKAAVEEMRKLGRYQGAAWSEALVRLKGSR